MACAPNACACVRMHRYSSQSALGCGDDAWPAACPSPLSARSASGDASACPGSVGPPPPTRCRIRMMCAPASCCVLSSSTAAPVLSSRCGAGRWESKLYLRGGEGGGWRGARRARGTEGACSCHRPAAGAPGLPACNRQWGPEAGGAPPPKQRSCSPGALHAPQGDPMAAASQLGPQAAAAHVQDDAVQTRVKQLIQADRAPASIVPPHVLQPPGGRVGGRAGGRALRR